VLAGAGPAGAQYGALRDASLAALTELGARVHACELIRDGAAAEEAVEREVAAAHSHCERIDMLIVDGAGVFARAGAGRAGLRLCLEATWNATRALANAAWIPSEAGARIAYLAPAPGAGAHARACAAGLENLARTLSIEWARYGITPVAIAPGDDTDAGEVAAIAAYLASPAGAYFSGCLLDLRSPAASGSELQR
jgi:NAD(P)-dependent dehydrogenase (short-subunit alcohol dehydrogenase family)